MKSSTKTPQLPLLPEETALDKLDKRVRSTYLNGEQYVSILDILKYHGNKKNPTQSWQVTIDFMARQGYYTPRVEYGFTGTDGKRKAATPVINLETFLRIAQSAEVPEWESIRQWLAKLGADEIKSKAKRERENTINKHDRAGLGDRPEIRHLKAYDASIDSVKALNGIYAKMIAAPDYTDLANQEYQSFFGIGMFAKNLKKLLKTENIRQNLPTATLEMLVFGERRLHEILSTQQNLTNERAKQIIKVVIEPLGVYLRGLSELVGVDYITGKPLLGDGKR